MIDEIRAAQNINIFTNNLGVLKFFMCYGAVGKTTNGFKFIRISSHTPKNIQEGSDDIICEDNDILSHLTAPYW